MQPSEAVIQSLENMHIQAESQIIENDFEGAIKTYSEILLIEPDDETAYTGLGHCYLVLGQYRNAHDAYKNALAINPENPSAILGIQKIMDPDGLEGMVHPLQVEAEEASQVFVQESPTELLTPKEIPAPATPAPPTQSKKMNIPAKTLKIPLPKIAPPKPAQGQAGKDIADPRDIQRALRNTGFYSGPIDGVLGESSRKAIKEYQILHELKPDGVVGPKTWASLKLYLESNSALPV